MSLKLILTAAPYIVIASLFGLVVHQKGLIKIKDAKIEQTTNNIKALERGVEQWRNKHGQEVSRSLQFEYTLSEFKNSTDKLNLELKELLKKQDIKLNKLEQIIYAHQSVDTIIYREIDIPTMPDTTLDLSDKNITNIIKLSPTRVSSQVALTNEVLLPMTARRETIGAPKKFFLFRWFQKKHIIVEGSWINTNPLITNKEQRFIKIIE